MIYTADFETNNSPTECRVWAWAICDTEDYYVQYGTSISEFMDFIATFPNNTKFYFHNLKFDGEFICSYLLKNGWNYYEDVKELQPNGFNCLISDMGAWYKITLKCGKHRISFLDSLKVLPFSVAEIAKSFKLDENKGRIDYNKIRPIDHKLTDSEIEYIKCDVRIMAKALHILNERGMDRMTAGSNALQYYKSITNKKQFEKWFPLPNNDAFIRKSYRGGWVYVNPLYQNKEIQSGIVLDVNSLYPSRMRYEVLPYGEPLYYEGKYKEYPGYPLYVQRISCSFEIKEGYFPTVQLKGYMKFLQTEYALTSNYEVIELTLTNVDLELFLEHYHVSRLVYHDGYMYRGSKGMFDTYVDYWMEEKIRCQEEGDGAGRTLAKLYQNSLYGKFAKRLEGQSKHPYLDENGILKLKLGEMEEQKGLYIPMGTFITAYARKYTISAAQNLHDRFLYADTDSLHILGDKLPTNLDIDPEKLGMWKCEMHFFAQSILEQNVM